jgi:hypothetical protein
MAITYHAGRRIQGTAADRTGSDAVTGGWKEVGRTTLGSSSYSIDVSSLPDKRYYMILANSIFTNPAGHDMRSRFNSDTGSNYSWRWSNNGGSDTTNTSQTYTSPLHDPWVSGGFVVANIANLSNKEKLIISHSVDSSTLGAGTAPRRKEDVGKWANTSNAISSYTLYEAGANPNTSGAEVVVLGYDPDDTHTSNFWEELADVTLSSAGDNLSSGTFTAKKYLWIQGYVKASGAIQGKIRVGNGSIDTGSNYADRNSVDGGSDGTNTSGTAIGVGGGGSTGGEFFNCFVINNTSNEKLFIIHSVKQNTTGAGTAPRRKEVVGKWSNTSNQINIVEYLQSESGSFDTGSFLKVWGSD